MRKHLPQLLFTFILLFSLYTVSAQQKLTVQLDAGGNQVPPFVRPFASRQEIAPGASGEVSVEYWMAQKELGSEIALRWNDQKLPVKSAAVFPIEQLPEGKMVVVSTPDWRVL